MVEVIVWPFLIGFIVFVFRIEIKKILSAFASILFKVERFNFKDLSLVLTNEKVPEASKILLTQQFISQENKVISLELLAQVVNALCDLKVFLNSYNGLYPSKKNSIKLLKTNLRILRDRLQVLQLLDGIDIQKIIDQLEQQASSINEQNNPIIDALSLFDLDHVNKNPEDFDLIMKIRKRILDNNKD